MKVQELFSKVKLPSLVRRLTIGYLYICQIGAVLQIGLLATTEIYERVLEMSIPNWLFGLANFITGLTPFTNNFLLNVIYVSVADGGIPIWVYYLVFALQLILVLVAINFVINILKALGEKQMQYDVMHSNSMNIGKIFLVIFVISGITILSGELVRSNNLADSLYYLFASLPSIQLFIALNAFIIGALIKEQKGLREEIDSVI